MPQWTIDGAQSGQMVDEERSFDGMELTFRVNRNTLTNVLRPLDEGAGKTKVIPQIDGGFSAIDLSENGNTYSFDPPTGHNPPRKSLTYHVEDFKEEPVDQKGNQFTVILKLIPDSNRTTTGTETVQSRSTGEWLFEFASGAIATSRISTEVKKIQETSVTAKRVKMILTPEQTNILESNLTKLNATRIRDVPDGTNFAEDNSPNDVNTVSVTAPSGETGGFLPSDKYVALNWTTRYLSAQRYEVQLDLGVHGTTALGATEPSPGTTPVPTTGSPPGTGYGNGGYGEGGYGE